MDDRVELIPIEDLRTNPRNARKYPKKQIQQIAASIDAFGFNSPILIDGENNVISGHGRLDAAKTLPFNPVPCLRLKHMMPAQQRAFVLADNRAAEGSQWDQELLAEELNQIFNLPQIDFSPEATGFTFPEIDGLIEEVAPEALDNPADDEVPAAPPQRVGPGDVWEIGNHRLVCGNALDPDVVKLAMAGARPAWCLPIRPTTCGSMAMSVVAARPATASS